MPSSSIVTNPLGISIEFVSSDTEHSYTSNVNNKIISYTSVTGLVSNYFKPFNALKVAEGVARKRSASENRIVTIEDIISEWDAKRDAACAYGTKIHEIAEDTIYDRPVRHKPTDGKETATFKYVAEAASKLKSRFTVVGVEQIVFDHRLRLAGTIDLLLKYEDTYLIVDWKTNKEIGDENKYTEFGLGPLQSVADTTKNHYALQLSIYEYLLRYAGYIPVNAPVKRILMHVTPFGVNKIPTDDMSSYVKNVVIDHLLTNLVA